VSSAPPLIELEGVAVTVGTTPILRRIDLTVLPGESVGMFGANGAGKTTLLRVIATLLEPTAGGGRIFGADLHAEERYRVRTRIGVVGHTPALYPELTLQENLSFVANIAGIDLARVPEVLGTVGLAGAAGRTAEACSYGMQRRTEFARLLLTEPDLVLLDEPHTALDVDAVDLVARMVQRTRDRGGAAVLVSHDRDRVAPITDRSVELTAGVLR
jgi:heme ABC exporter ATP-binding subunit CcmA